MSLGIGEMLEIVGCKISIPNSMAKVGKTGGTARALTEALATSRTLVTFIKEEVGARLSTLCHFALWTRISLGDITMVSSNEALPINFGWPSSDKDISMCLKIEGIGTKGCIKVGFIPIDD